MKSYEKVTNDLLKRRDNYVAMQKLKRKRVISFTASLGCFCMIVMVGIGLVKNGMFAPAIPNITEKNNAVYSNTEIQTEDFHKETDTPEQVGNSDKKNDIRIQHVEDIPSDSEKMFFHLSTDDFIPMGHDEINEYYGVNIFPVIPGDLQDTSNELLGIYKRKANGELYYDGNRLQYTNEDFSRCVAITIDKNCMPFDFCNLFADIEKRSAINNIEVGIAQKSTGEILAEFMYNDVGFRIFTSGLTQNEVISIIESLIK